MSGVIRYSTVSGIVALILSAFIALPVRAQDQAAQGADWQGDFGTAVPEAEIRPPLNLAGCWSGMIEDSTFGPGTGFIFVVQNGKKLVTGTHAELNLSPGSIGGPLAGSANSQTFRLAFHRKQCNVSFHGTLSSGDLTGMYHLSKKCAHAVLNGTFEFTFDATNASCP